MGPEKPPIRLEENMIEVGWTPEDASTPAEEEVEGSSRRAGRAGVSSGGEEAVRDHYAALQAWREWADNQARRVDRVPDVPEMEFEDEDEEIVESEELTDHPPAREDRPTVRVEGEQKFAPFGQLFSKMAQPREPS